MFVSELIMPEMYVTCLSYQIWTGSQLLDISPVVLYDLDKCTREWHIPYKEV